MKTLPRILATTFLILLLGNGAVFAADRGKGRNQSDAQWYADPERGWVKSDERGRDRKDDRRETPKDRRSNQKSRDRDKDRGRGSSDY
jgi:hypothetical protein